MLIRSIKTIFTPNESLVNIRANGSRIEMTGKFISFEWVRAKLGLPKSQVENSVTAHANRTAEPSLKRIGSIGKPLASRGMKKANGEIEGIESSYFRRGIKRVQGIIKLWRHRVTSRCLCHRGGAEVTTNRGVVNAERKLRQKAENPPGRRVGAGRYSQKARDLKVKALKFDISFATELKKHKEKIKHLEKRGKYLEEQAEFLMRLKSLRGLKGNNQREESLKGKGKILKQQAKALARCTEVWEEQVGQPNRKRVERARENLQRDAVLLGQLKREAENNVKALEKLEKKIVIELRPLYARKKERTRRNNGVCSSFGVLRDVRP